MFAGYPCLSGLSRRVDARRGARRERARRDAAPPLQAERAGSGSARGQRPAAEVEPEAALERRRVLQLGADVVRLGLRDLLVGDRLVDDRIRDRQDILGRLRLLLLDRLVDVVEHGRDALVQVERSRSATAAEAPRPGTEEREERERRVLQLVPDL